MLVLLPVGLDARSCWSRVASRCSSALWLWLVSWVAASTRSPATSPRILPPPFWHSSACSLLGLPGPGAPWGGWCPLSSTTLRPEELGRPSPSASTSSSPLSSAKPTSPCSASKLLEASLLCHCCTLLMMDAFGMLLLCCTWAARYYTGLLIKLTPRHSLFFSFHSLTILC